MHSAWISRLYLVLLNFLNYFGFHFTWATLRISLVSLAAGILIAINRFFLPKTFIEFSSARFPSATIVEIETFLFSFGTNLKTQTSTSEATLKDCLIQNWLWYWNSIVWGGDLLNLAIWSWGKLNENWETIELNEWEIFAWAASRTQIKFKTRTSEAPTHRRSDGWIFFSWISCCFQLHISFILYDITLAYGFTRICLRVVNKHSISIIAPLDARYVTHPDGCWLLPSTISHALSGIY